MTYGHTPQTREPIAIIGTGCRFPGDSTSPSKLWQLLRSPRDLTREIPAESRFNAKGFYNADGEHHGASNATKAYFIEEDPRHFDAGFFSISPREAESIDPQQRLLLEIVYEAMENAGLTLSSMRGSDTAAYMGAMSADYTDTQLRDIENVSQYMITGTSRALLSNRLSYFFDWKGPSISVDTACSSSLVAVHLGVQALRAGECKISCVGGSNVILNADCYLAATSFHLLSPTGKSQMWDQAGDGYARGEGICVFMMKTLSQAILNGDRIDAVIRETSTNQDGRTQGIAMPSAEAQISLMRAAYRNAGLDLSKAEDRPQYVEAHGTGTQAGDPKEASAIATTFFPPEYNHGHRPKLFVGSVKTVIGHTEGCAGIAGILKAVLAMRHKTIPPNQHFHNPNPNVEPFLKYLSVPTSPQSWPTVPPNTPLRASVNGFGSGGTNCHAIVEAYMPDIHGYGSWGKLEPPSSLSNSSLTSDVEFSPLPLLFSASSGVALRAMLERYAEYLENNDGISIQRLAMTLISHRSTFPVRISLKGRSRTEALQAIQKELAKGRSSPNAEVGTRSSVPEFDRMRRPKILGVFTGQGAQWAGMGHGLMQKSAVFRKTIEMMEEAMAQLPDGPDWSLKEEIMKPPSTTRLGEAGISLPIGAAIQVALVKVLRSAGISFTTVVGHSGGEIGTAFAAGKINEIDAIKIAYYRGVYTKLAIGKDGKKGAMIAVGFGYEEGLNFCSMKQFADRLTVAASNSPESVTLSGDLDAVQEAKEMLDAEGMFNRMLRLDTAYHSSHMYPCAAPYVAALHRCGIVAGESNGTAWASSVYEDSRMITADDDKDMGAEYWKENLIGRVLFSQALERALDAGNGDFDLALEVGPHPSLRGPALDTIRQKIGSDIPYAGVLDRKSDDISALSTALGFSWLTLGSGIVDFAGYASGFDSANAVDLAGPALPDLPTYPWDHQKVLYRESRLNKNVRNRVDAPHLLLGSRTPDDTDYEPRWRNFFIANELPWLRDHSIQNQVIVPAATYCIMALEAAKVLCRGKTVLSIELHDVAILRPIVLDAASDGTETLFSVRSDLDSNKNKNEIQAQFSLSAGTAEDRHLRTAATGNICITLADSEADARSLSTLFPARSTEGHLDLPPTNVERFYTSLKTIGLSYEGAFKAMTSMKRRLNVASSTVAIDSELVENASIHPTWLDACFQTFLAAVAAPLDGSLWTAFMPTTIGRMTFVASGDSKHTTASVTVDANITNFKPGYQVALPTLTGDMSIYDSSTNELQIKIEDFVMSSFLPAAEKDDRRLYLRNIWTQEMLSGALCESPDQVLPCSKNELKVLDSCESMIWYYLSNLKTADHLDVLAQKIPGLRSLISEMEASKTRIPSKSEIMSMFENGGEHIDLLLVRTIGEGLLNPPAESTNDQSSSMESLITRWHNEGLGFAQLQRHLVSATKQISHQHANLRVLQVGPSSPSLVRSICQELGRSLKNYTVVVDSKHNVDEMKAALVDDHLRVDFHHACVENGIDEVNHLTSDGLFDLVIVHKAFSKQVVALKTVRSIVRPGGFMLMMAATGTQFRFPFYMLAAPPLVDEDGSVQTKLTTPTRQEIDTLLCQLGFSGVDAIALDNEPSKHTFSIVVSQAVDDQIHFLRSPLKNPAPISLGGELLVVGGLFPNTSKMCDNIRGILQKAWQGDIISVSSLAELSEEASQVEAVLCLADLDRPVLENMRAPTFKGLRTLFTTAKTLLWLTHDSKGANPYHSAAIGLGRSVQSENPEKLIQFVDLDTVNGVETTIAETFLRLVGGVMMKKYDLMDSAHLWTAEPEMSFRNGKYFIPRMFPDDQRNHRLNALRRKVETQAVLQEQPIALLASRQVDGQVTYTAEALHGSVHPEAANDKVSIQVEYSSVDPVLPTVNDGHLFCCIGKTMDEKRVLCLSPHNSSIVTVPRARTFQINMDTPGEDGGAAFIALLGEIKALVIASSVPPGRTALIYEPDEHLASSLRKSSPGHRTVFAVTFQASSESDGQISFKPYASRKEIEAKLPPRTRMLIHVGGETTTRNFSALQKALPAHVAIVAFQELDIYDTKPEDILTKALTFLQSDSASGKIALESDSVAKASALVSGHHGRTAIVDWTGGQKLTITQTPLDNRGLFSPNKTYLLVGLTGQVGQSMCRWMVECGARHIVVTSRNPGKLGLLWRDELVRQGANIVVEAADVANKQHVAALCQRIDASMPPIGGIANGTMVLHDIMFNEMSFEGFQMAMVPKVQGSLYLEEAFADRDLEFFLFFSSVSVLTGQRTQANYVAANNFMVALAERRKARGLAASVIDIGMIVGIGVIQRSQNDAGFSTLETSIRQQHYMPTSEVDLHHLWTEAILAGRSEGSAEIITGLETYKSAAAAEPPFWHRNLRFSHLITDPDALEAGADPSKGADESLKEKLVSAGESGEATRVMENALLSYLAVSFKLSLETLYSDVPLIDLGFDSLVSVQIRNWIYSETGYDIPVLKILGGSSVSQICAEIVSSLSFDKSSTTAAKEEDESASKRKSRLWDRPSPTATSSEQAVSSTKANSLTNGHNGLANGTSKKKSRPAAKRKPTQKSNARSDVVSRGPRPTPLYTQPLSLGQSRLYFLSQYLKDDDVLNCTMSYAISGVLDMVRLEKSIDAVVQRHETMRTSFFTDEKEGRPVQGILKESPFQLKIVPGLSGSSDVENEFNLIRHRHYDLERADTFAATILSHSNDSHTIIFGYHHIIMDGVSWQIFQKDMAMFYNGSDEVTSPKNSPVQYSEFAEKQKRDLADGAYAERLQFFQQQFREPVELLPLFPFAKVGTRKAVDQYAVEEVVTRLDVSVADGIKKAAKANQITPFHFYLSAFQVLLHKLLDIDQMCIGVVDANRSDRKFMNTIGFFLETIPLLFEVDSNQQFADVLKTTRTKTYAAFAQGGVPTEEILKACGVASSATETPLFQVCFNYRMGAGRTSPLEGVEMKFTSYVDAKNPFDLVASVDDLDDGTAMITLYLQDYLYDQEGAQLLSSAYAHVLEAFSKNTGGLVNSAQAFNAALEEEAIELGTGPTLDLAPLFARTLSKIFNTWVESDPGTLAVKDANGNAMTYLQLSQRSDAIAAALMNAGIDILDTVGVLLEPGVDTVATILAILRIGAVYVPMDTRSSDTLLSQILGESRPSVVIRHAATASRAKKLSPVNAKLLTLDAVPRKTIRTVQDVSAVGRVAMTLYTSGSTGKPKGIPLTNANLRTPILGVSERVPLGREIVLQQSGQGFDAAVFQIFIALANGGTVIMADNRDDPANIAALMAREAVTCTTLITSEAQALLKYGYDQLRSCSSWRIALVAGETFTVNLLGQFRALSRPDLKVFNAYGPTEAAICTSISEVSFEDIDANDVSIPIGAALANLGTYIVDESCRPVPIGWPGEIAIVGPSVASGYHNLPDLTRAKFTTLASLGAVAGSSRVYLTGDKGRMLSDGSIVILGRVDGDDQVKIRGHRVQLGDVARALVQASRGIFADAAVLLKGDHLVAYVVFSRTSRVEDTATYLRQLKQELPVPSYMRPTVIIPLDTLPVTIRGKLDTKTLASLPLPNIVANGDEDQLTPTEARLREIWIDVLGEISLSVPIHRTSDFMSVGGNSLLLLPLKAKILQEFDAELSILELFQASTLELLGARIDGTSLLVQINWDEETEPTFALPLAATRTTNGARQNGSATEGISVLLTGATGFLGSAILRHLVKQPTVASVHCAALRPDDAGRPRPLCTESLKIVRHAGDLTLPFLGLADASIFDSVDVIIHNGAEVSLMKSYRSLRKANLASTAELARVAAARGIPIHYVSTGGVARLSGAEEQSETSLAAFYPPVDGSDGYVASKWASEVLLEKVQRRVGGLGVWVHRPSSIIGEGVSTLDVVHNLLKYSREMGAVPDLTGSTGFFDFIDVETVARNIVEECIATQGNGGLFFRHQSGERVVPIGELGAFVEKIEKRPVGVLLLQDWVAEAIVGGLDEVLGSFMLASKGVLRLPLLKRGQEA
ncbi:Nonribosomal peptide synthetase 14 [Xylaria scruposa]|nr:Nonribosomal peptide synthetase 14 [Xylaria scruposa]